MSTSSSTRFSLRFLRTYMTSVPEVEPEDFTAPPVLMVHPGADRWTPVERRLVLLDGCGHMPDEDPGVRQSADALRAFAAGMSPPAGA